MFLIDLSDGPISRSIVEYDIFMLRRVDILFFGQ